MTSAAVQVERLEALLVRVQRNRTQPRPASGDNGRSRDEASFEGVTSQRPAPEPIQAAQARPPAPLAPPEMSAPPVPRPQMRAITEPLAAPGPGASRPARTPLEMAVENKLERPSTHPHLQPSAAVTVPQPVSFARSGSDEPVMLADPPPPQASRGIGQVVSKSPPIAAQTFGDLLRRSLSLRPR
jgi:hypothetical protein